MFPNCSRRRWLYLQIILIGIALLRRLFLFVLIIGRLAYGQEFAKITVVDSLSQVPLEGATIVLSRSHTGAMTNAGGIAVLNIRVANDTGTVSFIGYYTRQFLHPGGGRTGDTIFYRIALAPLAIEYSQATVTSGRINSAISASPLRIEMLGSEELTEKLTENPHNVSELLSELSAVQMTQSSLASGATNFRLLGMPGRYTLLLKDGFPLFGGTMQELSFMQLLPVDLQQVEIIKGASSAFYGDGAVSGVINFISREPKARPELRAIASWDSYRGKAISAFYSSRNESLGYSVLLSGDARDPYDCNNDSYTDIPLSKKLVFEPALFYYTAGSSYKVQFSLTTEKRRGGFFTAVSGDEPALSSYILTNNSHNLKTTFAGVTQFSSQLSLDSRLAFVSMNTLSDVPGLSISAKQRSLFGEFAVHVNAELNKAVFGIAANQNQIVITTTDPDENEYRQTTIGLYALDEYNLSNQISVQGGVRYDVLVNGHAIACPTLAAAWHFSDHGFIRLSGGLAHKSPGLFSEEDGVLRESLVLPSSRNKQEESSSVMLDGSYRASLDEETFLSVNQAVYYIMVQNPVSLHRDAATGTFSQVNDAFPLRGWGSETNLRAIADDFSASVGFSWETVQRVAAKNSILPLSPRYKVVSVISFENEGLWECDLGAMFFGRQYIHDGTTVPQFGTYEAAFMFFLGNLKLVLNAENIGNVRQTNYQPLVTDTPSGPKFSEIWAPVTGRTIIGTIYYSF